MNVQQEVAEAKALFARDAATELVEQVNDAIERGAAEWRADPSARGVVGLVAPNSNRAFVVMYLEFPFDWEVDDEALATLGG